MCQGTFGRLLISLWEFTSMSSFHLIGASSYQKVLRRETVRKGVVRCWFGTLARMRKTYPTDLSDEEWSCIEPYMRAGLRTRGAGELYWRKGYQGFAAGGP